MRNYRSQIIFAIGIILISACGEPADKTASRVDSLTSLPIPLDTVNQHQVKADSDSAKVTTKPPVDKEVEVSEGIIYYTLPYCGGARPSEEILAEKKKSRLLTNSTLMLKNKKGDQYLVVTNAKGIFRSGIPAGQYDVYLTKNTNPEIYNVSPETCENCLTKPMTNMIIQKGIQATCVIHFNCGPNDKKRQ
jgi:hypothetical protein